MILHNFRICYNNLKGFLELLSNKWGVGMGYYILNRKIIIKRAILNFLLKFLLPTNKIVLNLSQSLDKSVSLRQNQLYNTYKTKTRLKKRTYLKYIA